MIKPLRNLLTIQNPPKVAGLEMNFKPQFIRRKVGRAVDVCIFVFFERMCFICSDILLLWCIREKMHGRNRWKTDIHLYKVKVKLSPFSQGWPKGSLFNSYYTQV